MSHSNYSIELGTDHFKKVQELIWGARSSYQNLAYALGLSPEDVTAITSSHRYATDDCFNAVLTEVLKNGVTQEDLARALEFRTLGYGQLARKVRAATFSPSSTPVAAEPHPTSQEKPRFGDNDRNTLQKEKDPKPAPIYLGEQVRKFLEDVVVLLHTVKEEELLAVYANLSPPTTPMLQLDNTIHCSPDGSISLTLGMFGNHKAAVIQTRKGADCRHEIRAALKALPHVQLIIAVGFAYGRREKCALGDVIVSTNVDGVNNIRFENGQIKFDEGIARYTNMSTRTENAFARRGWMTFNCVADGERERNVKIHTGVIISSPTLLNDRKALDCYLKNNERFIGGEMEGQELAQCVYSFREDQRSIDFIVIKGVADFGDGSKEKSWQLTASLAAAAYAEQKLRGTQGAMYYISGLAFSVDMSDDKFITFLKSKGLTQRDASTLTENGITATIFVDLTDEDINNPVLNLSFGGKMAIRKILSEIRKYLVNQ